MAVSPAVKNTAREAPHISGKVCEKYILMLHKIDGTLDPKINPLVAYFEPHLKKHRPKKIDFVFYSRGDWRVLGRRVLFRESDFRFDLECGGSEGFSDSDLRERRRLLESMRGIYGEEVVSQWDLKKFPLSDHFPICAELELL